MGWETLTGPVSSVKFDWAKKWAWLANVGFLLFFFWAFAIFSSSRFFFPQGVYREKKKVMKN